MRHDHIIDRLAQVNGFVTGVALYPQLIRAAVTGAIEGLSTTAFAIIFINSIVWIAYARHRHIAPLVVASVLNGIAAASLAVLSLR